MQGSRCDTSRNKVAVGEPVAGSDRSIMVVWDEITLCKGSFGSHGDEGRSGRRYVQEQQR